LLDLSEMREVEIRFIVIFIRCVMLIGVVVSFEGVVCGGGYVS
jgi:hypothetical protein